MDLREKPFPSLPILTVLRKLPRERMSEKGFAYVAGGAGAEQTMRNNRKALDEVRILPRMLKDVSQRDLIN